MEKIYNFAKKDFFIFASTYVAIIFLVLLCFFPVCRAFERSEQNQAIAEIRDYASSMLGELDLQEQAIFNATRNLYSDRDFTSIYYNSTHSSSSSLFYDMTLLQKRIKLYYQNLEYALVFSIPEKTTFSKEISLKELLYEQLLQLSQKTIILYQAENYIYCLMESVSGLSDLLSNCLKHIRELHNQSVKVGISNPFQDISYTQHASTQAKRRLSAGYRIDGVYVFTHTYSSRAVRSLISIQDLDNLQRALLSGNGQNADRILETIHQTISHSEQNSVELRQMFFSLRSVYATVCNQFSLEAERNGETRYHAPILPNDLDEYDLDSVYEVFRSLNIELQQQYEIVMARTARSLGTDILAYIDQNYTDPNLCAGVIADVFHISEKYVFQLLKSCCNETLNDRILRLRIDEGIRLLTTTDLTITTIAKKTGFSSSNTMYKAFMRVKGISPSSYRGKEI